jgi:DNA-binding MarR family transcriptional regulator
MKLDDDIVNPKRILIMTTLFIFREMVESDLAKATGIDWGSLSTHLQRLEKKGYIERKKAITSRGIRTIVRITEKGYKKYKEEVRKLKELIDFAEDS